MFGWWNLDSNLINSVASPELLGGRPGHLNAIRPPQGGLGSCSPADGREVSFLKRFKVLENEFIFKNNNIFGPKIHFIYWKFWKFQQILQTFLIFSKNNF